VSVSSNAKSEPVEVPNKPLTRIGNVSSTSSEQDGVNPGGFIVYVVSKHHGLIKTPPHLLVVPLLCQGLLRNVRLKALTWTFSPRKAV